LFCKILPNLCAKLLTADLSVVVVWQAGYTPLHTACHFGQVAMIRFLLECAAPVNAQTKVGNNWLATNSNFVKYYEGLAR